MVFRCCPGSLVRPAQVAGPPNGDCHGRGAKLVCGADQPNGGAESHPNTLTGNDANTLAPSVGQHVPTAGAKPGLAAGPLCLTAW